MQCLAAGDAVRLQHLLWAAAGISGNVLAPVEGEVRESWSKLHLDGRRSEFLLELFLILWFFLDVYDAGRCSQHVDLSAELKWEGREGGNRFGGHIELTPQVLKCVKVKIDPYV